MVRTLSLATLLLFAAVAQAADNPKVTRLKKEIATLKAQLAAKEAELAKLEPKPAAPPKAAVTYLAMNDLKKDQVGYFGYTTAAVVRNNRLIAPGTQSVGLLKVIQILDAKRALCGVVLERGVADQKVLVSGLDTSTLADGKVFPSPLVKVLGNITIEGRTFAHVEVSAPEKK